MRQNKDQDLGLEAQLRALMQDLKCNNAKPVVRICTNQYCDKPALFCVSSDCAECHDAHQNCGSFLFEKFTREIQKKTAGSLSQFYDRMGQIQTNFVDRIQKAKRKYLYAFSLDELTTILERPYYNMVDSIYRGKNAQAITGKEASELFKRLEETELEEGSRELQLLETFQRESDRLLKEYISTKDWIFDSELGQHRFKKKIRDRDPQKTVQKFTIDSSVLSSTRREMTLEELVEYPSPKVRMFATIIAEEIQKIDNEFIFEQLNKPSNMLLAFRASNHDFKAKEFHQCCDGLDKTFVLAKNQYGKVIGAYTPLSWFGDGYKPDESYQSFLLGMNSKVKMSVANAYKAVYCSSKMGPTFGGESSLFGLKTSFDFSISDSCNSNENSSFFFPKSYRFKERPVEIEELCGMQKGGNFRIVEYEVYKVTYEEVPKEPVTVIKL